MNAVELEYNTETMEIQSWVLIGFLEGAKVVGRNNETIDLFIWFTCSTKTTFFDKK